MRFTTLIGAVLMTFACGSHAASNPAKPAGESRIRVFGQNGAMAELHAGKSCIKGHGERVSGSLGSAFGSLIGKVSNVSLGMPDTETTRHLSQTDGIASKVYFREYAIPAGVPTSLRLGFQDVSSFYTVGNVRYSGPSSSCRGAISFVPEAGRDYEVGFSWQGRVCQLSVNEIVDEGEQTRLEPVPVQSAPKC